MIESDICNFLLTEKPPKPDFLGCFSEHGKKANHPINQDDYDYSTITPSDIPIPRLLENAFVATEQKTRDFAGRGATGTVAYVTKNNDIHVAHLGDSPVFLICFDPTDNSVRNILINKNLHNSFNRRELNAPGIKKGFRREGIDVYPAVIEREGTLGLMLTRGFGDSNYDLGRTPDTPSLLATERIPGKNYTIQQLLNGGKRVYVAVCSDGCVDNQRTNTLDIISNAISLELQKDSRKGVKRPLDELISVVKNQRRFGDDATMVIQELTQNRDSDMALIVSDGHGTGGEEVAELVTKSLKEYVQSPELAAQIVGNGHSNNKGLTR